MRISDEILQELAHIGRKGVELVPPSLEDERIAWRNLVCGSDPWIEAASKIGYENLPHLIRGLILYCRASGRHIGGSVSPVIFLYEILIENEPDQEPNLTAWIVSNRTNPYEPFGTLNDEGATSYADYVARRKQRILKARTNEALEAARQTEVLQLIGK